MRVIEDDTWGALCIFAEARSEPWLGQVAVGNVIRNRTAMKFFSDGTVVSTVTRPYQFSWMNTKDSQRTRVLAVDDLDDSWHQAWTAWQTSEYESVVADAVFYHADYVNPSWRNEVDFIRQIGRHLFYRR